MSILVVGSVALDTVRTPSGLRRDILGGSATYFSLSASFFNPVNLVAVVGNDFPPAYLDFFKQKRINLKGLKVEKGKTFRWEGIYGKDLKDPKTISTCLNVFARFRPQVPEEYKKSKYLFLANIDPAVQTRVLQCLARPKLVVCDTMNYWIENKPGELLSLLKNVDFFLLNDLEAKMLTGEANLSRAAKKLIALGPKGVVVKRGEHGAAVFTKHFIFSLPAFLLDKITDPTGAGDTFAGGFVGYLAKCKKINQASIRKAVAYGSIMATFAVQDFSVGRLKTVKKKDIDQRFKVFKERIFF